MERRNEIIALSPEQIQECIHNYSNKKISHIILSSAGLANTNYIITLDDDEKIVLRIYSDKDANPGLKEFNISKLLKSFPAVPKVLYFQPLASNKPHYSIFQFIEGTTISELISNKQDLETVYFEIGLVLSNLKQINFKSFGLFDDNLNIVEIKNTNNLLHPITNYVLDCLNNDNLINRIGIKLTNSISNLIKQNDDILQTINERPHLVHGDFKIENIMVQQDTNMFHLVGILDWEHGRSGISYEDIATLFRNDYDKNSLLKKSFAKGYEAAGNQLIERWDEASKLIDLVNLCEFLCSDKERPKLYSKVIENLNQTINFFNDC